MRFTRPLHSFLLEHKRHSHEKYDVVNTRILFTNSGPSKGIHERKEEKSKPEMKKKMYDIYFVVPEI